MRRWGDAVKRGHQDTEKRRNGDKGIRRHEKIGRLIMIDGEIVGHDDREM